MEHLAKIFRQTLYLLKHQSQWPRKDTLTDMMLYWHQSSQNNSFLSLTRMKEAPALLLQLCEVQCDQELLMRHQRPCSPTWVLYSLHYCGAAARAGAREKVYVAADGRHILCADPQAFPSLTLLLLQ